MSLCYLSAKLAKYGIPMKPLDDYLEELTKTKTDGKVNMFLFSFLQSLF